MYFTNIDSHEMIDEAIGIEAAIDGVHGLQVIEELDHLAVMARQILTLQAVIIESVSVRIDTPEGIAEVAEIENGTGTVDLQDAMPGETMMRDHLGGIGTYSTIVEEEVEDAAETEAIGMVVLEVEEENARRAHPLRRRRKSQLRT